MSTNKDNIVRPTNYSFLPDDIVDLYKKYNKKGPTEGQKSYILKLTGNDPFPCAGKILEREVKCWEDIAPFEVFKIVNGLQKQSTLLPFQMLEVKKQSLKEISKLLNKEINDYEDLRYRDYKIITQSLDKFPLKSNDHPIITNCLYEYGIQHYKEIQNKDPIFKDNKMKYLKFYDLMMIDLDGDVDLDLVKEKISKLELTFALYKTYNGYHLFLLSKMCNHYDKTSMDIMKYLGSDEYYRRFVYKNGYKIRLTPKLGREEPFVAKFIEIIGDKNKIIPQLKQLLDIHDNYINDSKYH